MTRNMEWLDAAVVLSSLCIIFFIAVSLVFKTVPDNQLAILASIASGISGTILGAYAGFRWATSKQASETIANLARNTQQPQSVVVTNGPGDPVPVEDGK